MRKLIVFNNVSLDGYFVDAKGDMSWAHQGMEDAEFRAFVQNNAANAGGEMLFGRLTYELMASYWPTQLAAENDPIVARGMNNAAKVVFSTTMDNASWSNTKLIKQDVAGIVRRMKAEDGNGMVVFGSGTIITLLSRERLIDEYQLVVNPVVLGGGRTMFEGIDGRMPLKLTQSRAFGNGKVLLHYARTDGS